MDMVKALRPKDIKWKPKSWYRGFLKRWKHKLQLRTVKGLSMARIRNKTLDDVKEWVEWFPDWMEANGLSFQWLINGDECRVIVGGEPQSMV